MEFRFWLRFETGERSGDRVPIPADGLAAGRRSDNGLVLSDPSVSGRHARFVVMGGTVVLEDLGSTNGTRVEGKRIESARLGPGDQVRLGAVEFTFYDEGGEDQGPVLEPAEEPAPRAAASPTAPAAGGIVLEEDGIALEGGDELFGAEEAGEELGSISADQLARSGSRSALVGVMLVVVAVGAAGAWWWFGRGAAKENARRTVAEVPGNLLVNPSFESEGGWEADEGAADSFFQAPAWRVSGEAGLGAALDAGDWARSWSASVTVDTGRGLDFSGTASVTGDVRLELGVELSSSSGLFAPVVVMAPSIEGEAGAEETELDLELPYLAGCDRARVVLVARAGGAQGEAAVDDLALVVSSAARAPAATFQEMEFHALGAPARSAALTRIDRVLLGNLASAREDGAALALDTQAQETGVQLRAAGAGRFAGTVAPSVARQGVATLGQGGYRTHPLDFEAAGVTDLLVGDRIDLVRFRFTSPVKLTGRAVNNSLAFEALGSGASDVFLQVGFRDERNRASALAEEARAAERKGDLGGAIARWSELLDELPFDTRLVAEAGDARGRMIQQGLDQVGELEAAFERARFFQLPALFEEVRGAARGVSATYAGSPVDDAAETLASAVEAELGKFSQGAGAAGARRLEFVLEGSGPWADGLLGKHVRAELERLRAEGAQ